MKIIDCDQMSEQWFKERLGIPTASNFDKIITTKGEQSKQRTKYMYQLAAERITLKSEETYKNTAIEEGIRREEEARNMYAMIKGVEVVKVGLCITEGDLICAASPDGMVGQDGCIEIKNPLATTHIEYLIKNELPIDYIQQTQGQLFVTGRKWVDFISHYPGMKPLIIRAYPDKEFQKALRRELEIFCAELNELVERIK